MQGSLVDRLEEGILGADARGLGDLAQDLVVLGESRTVMSIATVTESVA